MTPNFEVAAIHFTRDCNLNCSFCYRSHEKVKELPHEFWYGIVPHLKTLNIPQIALGGGEPMLYPDFIKKLGEVCSREKMILNITSNGTLFQNYSKAKLKRILGNVTMISLSLDREKVKGKVEFEQYTKNVKMLKSIGVQVGSNLLVDEITLNKLITIVNKLFAIGIDRVFTLCPKNVMIPDLLKARIKYVYLTAKYPKFYVDDLTNSILLENKYSKWKRPCHYGKIISIDEQGFVKGCSFDHKFVLKLKEPSDILKIKNVRFEERHCCPFLVKPKEVRKIEPNTKL